MSNLVVSQTAALAKSLSLAPGDTDELVAVLKATAFKGQVSDAQMTALLVVANQYGLNPWTKEIYAFPDRQNGIVPVVGVDGWSRIINSHPQFDGMDFDQDDERCTCIIYRKDRAHPIRVTEYMAECKRDGVGPWRSHPRRMLRHKAMIQCARLAFGFVGIYEQDEAERILEAHVSEVPADRTAKLAPYPPESFDKNLPKWRELIESGGKTADEIIATVSTKGTLSAEQEKLIRGEIADGEIVEMEPVA
jgi:phage recombination protein Bet